MWGHSTLGGIFTEHVFGACMAKLSPCPYGAPGEQLWVRETWRAFGGVDARFQYKADNAVRESRAAMLVKSVPWDSMSQATRTALADVVYNDGGIGLADAQWRTPIFMPRVASRIDLEIVSVRVERLHEITIADAEAEGAEFTDGIGWSFGMATKLGTTSIGAFLGVWDTINGAGSWASNPWVWRIEFKRIDATPEPQ